MIRSARPLPPPPPLSPARDLARPLPRLGRARRRGNGNGKRLVRFFLFSSLKQKVNALTSRGPSTVTSYQPPGRAERRGDVPARPSSRLPSAPPSRRRRRRRRRACGKPPSSPRAAVGGPSPRPRSTSPPSDRRAPPGAAWLPERVVPAGNCGLEPRLERTGEGGRPPHRVSPEPAPPGSSPRSPAGPGACA